MIIIGITGTIGAGKGTVVEYLVRKKGYIHFSVRVFILKEIRQHNLPETRDSMRVVANQLRKTHSPSYIVDSLYDLALASGFNSVIESIRTEGEIISLRQKGSFYLLSVDADPRLRYDRITKRGSETDYVSYEEFINNEKAESVSADPGRQNLIRCMELSDFRLTNNGKREELFSQLENILTIIHKNN